MKRYFDTRGSLMISSLLLLLIFLSYWNYENYHRQKGLLLQNLETQAKLTHSQKLDSTFNIVMNVFEEEAVKTGQIIKTEEKEIITNAKSGRMTMKMITSSDTLHQDWTSTGMLDTLLTKSSFKLKLDRDSLIIHELKNYSFNPFDTVEFTGNYKKNLLKQRLPFSFNLSSDTLISNRDDLLVTLHFDKRNEAQLYAVFKDYQHYILAKIWPSLLMSFLLFTLVSFAFYLIYKSWLEQSRLVQIKNEFVSNMTHELKTPISTMSVALEAMSDFGVLRDAEKSKEYIDISKKELHRLGIMVDKVLLMSKFESGDTVLSFEQIDLQRIIEDILATMKLYFEKMNVQTSFNLTGTDFHMYGDRIHLTNVIYNMIDNSIKYSEEAPKIELSLEKQSDQLALTIRDEGKGIPKEYLDKIFTRFFRVPNKDRHDVKGHGLGLSYVKKIIDQHQGSIKVASKEGEGSTFKIHLPIKHRHV